MNEEQKVVNITFSTQEAEQLLKLIDVAVRAAGLEVAKSAVILVEKIVAGVNST